MFVVCSHGVKVMADKNRLVGVYGGESGVKVAHLQRRQAKECR